nr:unnamed protein product [Callosobruchus chinensis]
MKQIKPTILKQIYPKGLSGKEQVLLCRLRIGHTNVTHAHLLNRNPTPRCLRCNEVLTVEHILTAQNMNTLDTPYTSARISIPHYPLHSQALKR